MNIKKKLNESLLLDERNNNNVNNVVINGIGLGEDSIANRINAGLEDLISSRDLEKNMKGTKNRSNAKEKGSIFNTLSKKYNDINTIVDIDNSNQDYSLDDLSANKFSKKKEEKSRIARKNGKGKSKTKSKLEDKEKDTEIDTYYDKSEKQSQTVDTNYQADQSNVNDNLEDENETDSHDDKSGSFKLIPSNLGGMYSKKPRKRGKSKAVIKEKDVESNDNNDLMKSMEGDKDANEEISKTKKTKNKNKKSYSSKLDNVTDDEDERISEGKDDINEMEVRKYIDKKGKVKNKSTSRNKKR